LPFVSPSIVADMSRSTMALLASWSPPRSIASLPLMKTQRSSSPWKLKISPPVYLN